MVRIPTAVVALLLATACSTDDPGGAAQPSTVQRAELRVTWSTAGLRPFYIEGAVPTVRLRDRTGELVRPTRESDEEAGWDLPPGAYDVVAGLRVCNGSCGELGPRVDGCRTTVDVSEVSDATEVEVLLRPGRRCVITE